MELDNKINDLFVDVKAEKKKKKSSSTTITTKGDSSEFELKQIEFNLNRHLQEKQKLKFKKVSICENNTHMYNADTFARHVDEEIEEKFRTKKWSGIPLYMKWNLVQKYLGENSIFEKKQIAEYKSKLSSNKLIVVYDHTEQKITSIEKLD